MTAQNDKTAQGEKTAPPRLYVITIETPSLGDRTYLVHDGDCALVIDPQRDVERVLDAADRAGVRIVRIAETHLHNDYVSGALLLARITGATLVHAGAEDLTFNHEAVADGDRFAVGGLEVEVRATPGHTPHHLGYVVRPADQGGDQSPAVFTGGSLLYGSVGRTDLLGEGRTDELTRAQYRSTRRLAASLPDDAQVYPTHGFGSFCSSTSSESESDGRLGTERSINVALTIDDEDEFVDRLLGGLTSYPRYYAHMGPLNRAGAGGIDASPARRVDPAEVATRIHRGEWVVDLRPRRAFADEHLAGTINIAVGDQFATYLGWLLPWAMPVTLLADDDDDIAEAQRQLARIGIDRPAGASSAPLDQWPGDQWTGDPGRRSYRAISFEQVANAEGSVLDVRRDDERRKGHLAGSIHLPLEELLERLHELPDRRLLVHCASGYRAAIAASLLDRAGREVELIDDDYES